MTTTDKYGTESMFEIQPGGGAAPTELRSTRAKPEAYAYCPSCDRRNGRNEKLTTGLTRVGAHLVWVSHNITTWSGSRRPCAAAGIPVCQRPPKVGAQACPCGGGD